MGAFVLLLIQENVKREKEILALSVIVGFRAEGVQKIIFISQLS